MKKIMKSIFKNALVQWMIAVFAAFVIWFIFLSSRRKIEGEEILKNLKGKPAVFAFWHGRSFVLSPLVYLYGLDGYAVSSIHEDGRLMAKLQRLFGLKPIKGSSKRDSLSVLRGGLSVLKKGKVLMMTPDGPRGPRMQLKDGILYFAKMTGVPIIPICYSCSRARFNKNWDKYMLALPFGRIKFNLGNPVFVPRNATENEWNLIREDLEKTMVDQLHKLDAEFGYDALTQGEFKGQI
ncbi:MAG: lysophospholipid acyltransferase family protein [Rickettsiales bacterium]|jgi:lysophospholipid acyltransferase (LPLAT)-like uncharacterized protein|nr:lysophospholipid acyltransferase family protein [Rickettsiales bacterium]